MPAGNYKGSGSQFHVFSAPTAYVAKVPELVKGYIGVPLTSGAIGTAFDMHILGEFSLPALSGADYGNKVWMTTATGALTLTMAVGTSLVGHVSRLPGDEGCPTGTMWVIWAPQPGAAGTA